MTPGGDGICSYGEQSNDQWNPQSPGQNNANVCGVIGTYNCHGFCCFNENYSTCKTSACNSNLLIGPSIQPQAGSNCKQKMTDYSGILMPSETIDESSNNCPVANSPVICDTRVYSPNQLTCSDIGDRTCLGQLRCIDPITRDTTTCPFENDQNDPRNLWVGMDYGADCFIDGSNHKRKMYRSLMAQAQEGQNYKVCGCEEAFF